MAEIKYRDMEEEERERALEVYGEELITLVDEIQDTITGEEEPTGITALAVVLNGLLRDLNDGFEEETGRRDAKIDEICYEIDIVIDSFLQEVSGTEAGFDIDELEDTSSGKDYQIREEYTNNV